MSASEGAAQALPRVVLRRRRAQPFFYRHPWVFAGAIARVEGEPALGAETLLVSDHGDVIARGLFNPASQIKLRLYSWRSEEPLDDDFFRTKIDHALAYREQLGCLRGAESAARLIASEGDGLSGLTVDRYGEWLTIQLTAGSLDTRLETIVAHLQSRLQPQGVVLRTERGMSDAEGLTRRDGLLAGESPPRPLFITEGNLQFGVDLLEGQKTGFYLDQRDNRAAAARYLTGRKVLDLFCYTGAFGLSALAQGGAASVHGVDVSQSAIHLAGENARLNGCDDRATYEVNPVFTALETFAGESTRFDAVILDPPKMARRRKSIDKALKGYHSLNRMALDLLPPGGILISSSCSGLVTRSDFARVLAGVAQRAGRDLQILEARGAAGDHPTMVSCPESAYLKCFICRLGP